jgi:hypothetical protein
VLVTEGAECRDQGDVVALARCGDPASLVLPATFHLMLRFRAGGFLEMARDDLGL